MKRLVACKQRPNLVRTGGLSLKGLIDLVKRKAIGSFGFVVNSNANVESMSTTSNQPQELLVDRLLSQATGMWTFDRAEVVTDPID
jgi:hypothetical protein